MNRSYLFVPADSDRKLAKAGDAGADALILDLEDAVAPERKSQARQMAHEFLRDRQKAWIRINPLDGGDADEDLAAVIPAGPSGIVLPKARGAGDVDRLSRELDALEHRHGLPAGQIRILALCTERPEALFDLASYAEPNPRLLGLSWGAEDLSAALGAAANRDADGNWLPVYELARSLCLLAAAAAGIAAVDTVFTDFRNDGGLARYAENARRDGFAGMLAIHPRQLDIINRAFVPTAAEIVRAERIIALFDANPGAGTLGLDGEMIDRPHLLQAQRIMELAKRLAAQE